jgi:hypothetical protein
MLLHRISLFIWCGLLLYGPPALAQPPGPVVFCSEYPDSPLCAAGEVSCLTCHSAPPALNPFGMDVSQRLAVGVPRPLSAAVYAQGLPEALRAAADFDSDADGVSNVDEIRAGTDPSLAASKPGACGDRDDCAYDAAYVYRKMMLDFCGRSPSYSERQAFAKAKNSAQTLREALDQCLVSEFWRGRDGVVWNLASAKIRPIQSIKSGADAGPIPLADYYRDYAMFVYAQTGDRDARDLLRAQYLVEASPERPTTYTRFERSATDDLAIDFNVGETVNIPERAGMITSRWFRTINTMFTPVPRTTAAQAYRAYLGLDIALLQGLQPGNTREPVDYDRKGVRAAGCIVCHQTLDPLAYPFSRYEAIDFDDLSFTGPDFMAYRRDRMTRFTVIESPQILDVPEEGSIFGKPVRNVVEWAEVAANSDEFAQKIVADYWQLVFRQAPSGADLSTFTTLWKRLRNEHGYRVEALLHDLIETEAYGVR